MNVISELIVGDDSHEAIRTLVAAILATEVANQKALAVIAAEDPSQWDFNVVIERNDVLDVFNDQTGSSKTPVVNVYVDTVNYDMSKSTMAYQQGSVIIGIDCFARGTAHGSGSTHQPGDLTAALACQRITRLVRNIIMADIYTHLGLPPATRIVGRRFIESIVYPRIDNRDDGIQIAASQLRLEVLLYQSSPINILELLESIFVDITIDPQGLVISMQPL